MEVMVRWVGLDVHKETIAIAVADGHGSRPENVATIPNETRRLLKRLKKLGGPGRVRVCYEAGPTGFELYRQLCEQGYKCIVVAPSLVPRRSGDRIKTDRRDARNLARFYRSGDLTAIHVPEEETEAMRDLERARGDAKKAERVARQQLVKFLLRHGRRYMEGSHWTQKHLDWVRRQKFSEEACNRVLVDYVRTVEEATRRVEELTQAIAELCDSWALAPEVKALQALRGVRLVTAATIIAEIGNMRRFASAPEFMSYLGLVPSEHSSGESRRQGAITKAGNGHVRRVLVEAAWSYRFRPALSGDLRRRNEGVPEDVRRIAWKAQQRLHQRYVRMMNRGLPKQKVVTALARELAGFVWDIARSTWNVPSCPQAEGEGVAR